MTDDIGTRLGKLTRSERHAVYESAEAKAEVQHIDFVDALVDTLDEFHPDKPSADDVLLALRMLTDMLHIDGMPGVTWLDAAQYANDVPASHLPDPGYSPVTDAIHVLRK